MSQTNKQKDMAENPNRRRSLYLANIIFLSCLTIASLLFALVVFFRLRTHGTDGIRQFYTYGQIRKIEETAAENERRDLLLEIRTSLESGRSTTQMLRDIFDDSIVVVSGGQYYFYPLAEEVEKNPLGAGILYGSEGRVVCSEESLSVKISHGILLSDNNGKIDWDRLADSGIEEVTVRAGILGKNRFVPDQQAERNCRYAVEKGKRISLSLEVEGPAGKDTIEEAMAAVRKVTALYGVRRLPQEDEEGEDADELSGPEFAAGGAVDPVIVLRIRTAEEVSDDGKDTDEWTASLKELCEAAKAEGIRPVIGAGLFASAAQIDLTPLAEYDRWLIDHEETASYPYSFSFWEYSAEGSMEGVPGKSILYARIDVSGDTEIPESEAEDSMRKARWPSADTPDM